jgi:hypothetical protein
MARMFNLNKVRSFFQKRKQILVDGCCDTETTCCVPGTGLRKYKVYYDNGGLPIEINDASNFLTTIAINTKWSIYLETTSSSVDVTSIIVTPSPILGLLVGLTPDTVAHPGSKVIVEANWATTGTRTFSVLITTNSGNFSFYAEIKVL